MDDIEERPSKMRKLNTLESAVEPAIEFREASIALSETPSINEELPLPDPAPSTSTPPALSKSALKKLRRKEAWVAGADYRRIKRREKHKEKQARKASARLELESKIASGELPPPPTPAVKTNARPVQVPIGLIIDCGFDELMIDKELISLGSQLTRCYSENRSAKYRTHLCISGWGGRLKERFETVLKNNHESWRGVIFEQGDFVKAGTVVDVAMRGKQGGKIVGALKSDEEREDAEGAMNGGHSKPEALKEEMNGAKSSPATETHVEQPVFKTDRSTEGKAQSGEPIDLSGNAIHESFPHPPPQLVYLSSDSPHTLNALSPNTSYIIGGLVDKNRHKGICYRRAVELGIPTAKLPIGEYMVMQSRTVLAVNHVAEIMVRWLEEGDWGVAFEKVIPKRKGGVLRGKEGKGEAGAEDEDEDEDEDENEDVEDEGIEEGNAKGEEETETVGVL